MFNIPLLSLQFFQKCLLLPYIRASWHGLKCLLVLPPRISPAEKLHGYLPPLRVCPTSLSWSIFWFSHHCSSPCHSLNHTKKTQSASCDLLYQEGLHEVKCFIKLVHSLFKYISLEGQVHNKNVGKIHL